MRTSTVVFVTAAVAALTSVGSFKAHGSFVPYGVQENVPVSTVTGSWGWQVAYSDVYGSGDVSISTLFASVPAGSYVMYAARPVGAANYTLLAAALESDARSYTARNTTTTANGAEWYYNGGSMGFAGLGDIITQNSADIQDSSLDYYTGQNGNLRLSWHTSAYTGSGYNQDYNLSPVELEPGWRAGYADWLNSSVDWERAVLFAPVPEPSTYLAGALLLLPFGASAMRSLRNRK
jgi:hypothetical protein